MLDFSLKIRHFRNLRWFFYKHGSLALFQRCITQDPITKNCFKDVLNRTPSPKNVLTIFYRIWCWSLCCSKGVHLFLTSYGSGQQCLNIIVLCVREDYFLIAKQFNFVFKSFIFSKISSEILRYPVGKGRKYSLLVQ